MIIIIMKKKMFQQNYKKCKKRNQKPLFMA